MPNERHARLAELAGSAREECYRGLDRQWDAYNEYVHVLAEKVFLEVVKPFLRRRDWTLVTGMGEWTMRNTSGDIVMDHPIQDEEVRRVMELMEQGVPGLPANDLGSLMPDYPPSRKEEGIAKENPVRE